MRATPARRSTQHSINLARRTPSAPPRFRAPLLRPARRPPPVALPPLRWQRPAPPVLLLLPLGPAGLRCGLLRCCSRAGCGGWPPASALRSGGGARLGVMVATTSTASVCVCVSVCVSVCVCRWGRGGTKARPRWHCLRVNRHMHEYTMLNTHTHTHAHTHTPAHTHTCTLAHTRTRTCSRLSVMKRPPSSP
jgi:hypothetical protein